MFIQDFGLKDGAQNKVYMDNLSSEMFNSVEGLFWIILGVVGWWCNFKLERKFKMWALFSSMVLVTFGISDFVQVFYGSFFQPHLLWLLIWKVIGVAGLVVSIIWYILIRLRNS